MVNANSGKKLCIYYWFDNPEALDEQEYIELHQPYTPKLAHPNVKHPEKEFLAL